ncbi:DUF559 domain-containing protein [Leifsonia sp. LS-T14]|uniref:DUF559 domain-containing protein n=1 Tax=unclassified Leifsonia TaxID=2663824 RepID=UPI0035A6C809
MGRYATPLPGRFSWAPFRVTDATAAGIGNGRLRGSDLMRPVRGVRAPADADLPTRCRALLLHRPAGMAFSHTTAAQLYGAPLPFRLDTDTIHVTVTAPSRAPQISGVIGHVARRAHTTLRNGLPLTSPAATWLDLAATLRRHELVAVGDYLLAQGLTTAEELAEALDDALGRRGVAAARLALPLLREGSESPAESALRVVLHDAGVVPPCLNYRIHSREGTFVARVDMAYPDQRLVIEYEGDHHRIDRDQWHKDIRRQARLEDLGWRVIRATAADLTDPDDFLLRIRRALAREW